jgi:hypothetical protein
MTTERFHKALTQNTSINKVPILGKSDRKRLEVAPLVLGESGPVELLRTLAEDGYRPRILGGIAGSATGVTEAATIRIQELSGG